MKIHKQLIKNTTDKKVLTITKKEFINYIPQALIWAVENKLSEYYLEVADNIDCLDYHIRSYICGKSNRMHRIYFEMRRLEPTLVAKESVILLLMHLEALIKDNEVYEYMQRFSALKTKVLALLNKINHHEIDIEELNNFNLKHNLNNN